MFVTDRTGSIEIGIELKTTSSAMKTTLFRTIAAIDVTAAGTALRGVTGINSDDTTAFCFGFVFQKGAQLGKRPTMEAAHLFALSGLDALSDVGEVFDHNRRAGPIPAKYDWRERGHNPVGSVVDVPRGGADAFWHCGSLWIGEHVGGGSFLFHFPVSLPMKAVVARNGRTGHAQIYADCLSVVDKDDGI